MARFSLFVLSLVSFIICSFVSAESGLRQQQPPQPLGLHQLAALLRGAASGPSDATVKQGKAIKVEGVAPTSYVLGSVCGSGVQVALGLGGCSYYDGLYYQFTVVNSQLVLSAYVGPCTGSYTSKTVAASSCGQGYAYSIGATSTTLPAAPTSGGGVETYYSANTCGSTVIGWLYAPFGSCFTVSDGSFLASSCSGSGIAGSAYSTSDCSGSGSSYTVPATSCSSAFTTTLNDEIAQQIGAQGFSMTCYASASSGGSSGSSSCFAGSEVVRLASGETKAIADVVVGDSIEVYSVRDKDIHFSDVIAVPHAKNSIVTDFQHIVTEQGSDVKLTADHLLPAGTCGSATELPLSRAADVEVGACIQTVLGQETVAANVVTKGEGVYTVVAEKGDYIVVNNVVASPFAVNHVVANGFYDIHRALYSLVGPAIASSVLLKTYLGSLNNLAAYFAK